MDPLQQPPSGTRKRKTSHINPMDMGETWDDDDAPWESEAQGYTIEASGRSLVLSNKQANELSEQYRYFGAAWGKGSHFKERGTKRLKWQDVPYSTCALVVAFLLEGKIILDILIDYPPTDSKSKSANEESNELELSTYTNFMQLCDKINVVPFFSNPKNPQENLCQDKEQMSLYLETYANLRAHTRVSRLIINSPEINALRRTDGFNDSFPVPDFLLTSGAITATPFLAIGSQRNDRRGKLTIMSRVSISALFHHFISIVDDLGPRGPDSGAQPRIRILACVTRGTWGWIRQQIAGRDGGRLSVLQRSSFERLKWHGRLEQSAIAETVLELIKERTVQYRDDGNYPTGGSNNCKLRITKPNADVLESLASGMTEFCGTDTPLLWDPSKPSFSVFAPLAKVKGILNCISNARTTPVYGNMKINQVTLW